MLLPDIQISISKSLSKIKMAGNGKDEWVRKAGEKTALQEKHYTVGAQV